MLMVPLLAAALLTPPLAALPPPELRTAPPPHPTLWPEGLVLARRPFSMPGLTCLLSGWSESRSSMLFLLALVDAMK